MWCILRALTKMELVVKFWPQNQAYDPDYADWLQQAGVEVIVGDEVRDNFAGWLAANQHRLDYVLLSRPTVAPEFLPLLRQSSRAKILFYGHDVHHARLLKEHELTGSETTRREAEEFRKLEHSLWREVDVVYYPSFSETEMVRTAVPGVRAETMPLYFFDDVPPMEEPKKRQGILFVAGFGHPPNVDAAMWLVRTIMPLVRSRVSGDVHLWLVGSNPTDEILQLASPDLTVTGYVTDAALREFYRTARVAIVPLRFGAGVKGKVLEALHHGLPLVTTPVGAQGLDGLDAVVPFSGDEDFLALQVSRLLRDDVYWDEISRKQQKYMEGKFSMEAMQHALRRGLSSALSDVGSA
jgi:glycosyltransferase involved in cell wall biosynthesis